MRRLAVTFVLLLALLALPAPASAVGPEWLRAKLGRELRLAGATTGAYVVDLETGKALFAARADVARPPASVEKLYTTSTALLRLGPDFAFHTQVLASAPGPDGVIDGDVWLRGEGDPTLNTARLGDLAQRLGSAGVTRITGGVAGDGTAFDQLPGSFRTGGRFDTDMGGALAGLAVARGLQRGRPQRTPALVAARALAAALRRNEITVAGKTTVGPAPAGAQVIADVPSPPLRTLIGLTNRPSDNYYAESLLKVLGERLGGGGTTTAGAAIVRAQLASFGVHPRVADGSGLARANRTTPRQVVRLLDRMDAQELGATFRASLPVAGRTGTLHNRMRRTPAAGRCTAKTGTLRFVSALAGYCPSADGHTLAFAVMGSGVNTFRAKKREDRIAAALARVTVG